MRILLLNYEYPPIGGGGGTASEQLARRLVLLGYEVTVVTGGFPGLQAQEQREGVTLIRIPTWRKRADACGIAEMAVFSLSSAWHLPRLVKQAGADVVLAFFSIPCGPAAWWLHKKTKIPYIIALRGGDVPGFLPEQLAKWHAISNWLTRRIWRQAAAMTANSAGLAGLAQEFMSDVAIQVIPNGVDEAFFIDRSARQPGPCLKALFAGRLTRQKRVDRLFPVLALAHKGIALRLAGDGPERAALEVMAEGLPTGTATFLGWCARKDLLAEYAGADVFVLASDYEGMPNVVLEAMAAGLPVIATASSGTTDLIRDGINGFLVPADDPQAFCDRLHLLQNDPERLRSLSDAARLTARAYTWERAALTYGGLCAAVANHR
jgi:glycosyltransferase involved in cell wall biosynthesis